MKRSSFSASQIITDYVHKNLSTYEIAKLYNTNSNMIRRILKKAGIELRSKSDAQKASIKAGTSKHPTLGTTRTEETKLKISKGIRKTWKSLSPEEYQSRVNKAKETWANIPSEKKEEMTAAAQKAVLKASKEGSKLEKLLLKKLSDKYIVRHHEHILPNEKLEVDLFIPVLKVAIEIDGPSHFLPIWGEERLLGVMTADSEKNGHIINKGFVLIRIKNRATNNALSATKDLVNQILQILERVSIEFPANIVDRLIEVDFE